MADNRSKILNVALNLFATHGYDAVGVKQIVDEAAVTKPTLYHYFGSKKGLFETLLKEKSANLLTDLKQASDYHGDIVQSVTLVTRCYFDLAATQPMFYRLILLTWFSPQSSEIYESITALQHQQFELIEQLFLLASNDHGNMKRRHRMYAVSLRGMIDTYSGLSIQGYVQLDDDHMVYRIVHQFLHGIFS